jgi:hypothetical protein
MLLLSSSCFRRSPATLRTWAPRRTARRSTTRCGWHSSTLPAVSFLFCSSLQQWLASCPSPLLAFLPVSSARMCSPLLPVLVRYQHLTSIYLITLFEQVAHSCCLFVLSGRIRRCHRAAGLVFDAGAQLQRFEQSAIRLPVQWVSTGFRFPTDRVAVLSVPRCHAPLLPLLQNTRLCFM